MKLLLKQSGAVKVNAGNNRRMTPLHLATMLADNEEAVSCMLLESKADVNATTKKHGATPLHIAARGVATGCTGWTCTPHFCQRLFLRLMQIR